MKELISSFYINGVIMNFFVSIFASTGKFFVQLEDWFTHLQTDQYRLMFKVVDISTSETVGIAGLTSIDFVNRHSDVHFWVYG